MRAVIQRATSGEVLVDGEVVGRLALPADSAGSAGDEAGAGSAAQVSSRDVGTPGDADATISEATPAWEGSGGARQGLFVLLGVQRGDGPTQVTTVARKIAELRILNDERSALDVHAPILVISQFTLYGDTRKGRRPSWAHAAPGDEAEPLVDAVVADLRGRGLHVETGQFGAMMEVSLVNDGPFTVLVEA